MLNLRPTYVQHSSCWELHSLLVYSIRHIVEFIFVTVTYTESNQVAVRSKAWVWSRSIAATAGSNPAVGKSVVAIVCVCDQLIIPAECVCACVCVSDLETSTMKRSGPELHHKQKKTHFYRNIILTRNVMRRYLPLFPFYISQFSALLSFYWYHPNRVLSRVSTAASCPAGSEFLFHPWRTLIPLPGNPAACQ